MIVPDVNMLVYAEIDAFVQHRTAREWWEAVLNGERPVGIAGVAMFGFVRLTTNRRVFTEPLSIGDAIGRVQRWLGQPNVTFLVAGSRYLETAFQLLEQVGTGSNLTAAVQLAVHAIEHGGEVYSNDWDFGRFEGLRWVNPLAG